jgi:ADP-heptose:LPS heptosyltransferase
MSLNRSRVFQAVANGTLVATRWIERLVRGPLPDTPQALKSARCFLFFQYETALGSNIHATPVYEALKLALPDAKTVVACGKLGFEVLKHNPFVDYLIQTPDPYTHLFHAARFLRTYLREQQLAPDAIVTNTSNVRRSISLLALFTSNALRVGYTLAPRLYHFTLKRDSSTSLIANNLRLIGLMGHEHAHVEPRVAYTSTDLAEAEQWLQQNGTGNSAPRIVFVTQTSPTQRKSWPADRFVAVANQSISRYGANLIFVGTASEASAIASIRSKIKGKTLSLAGQTSIPSLAALLSSSDLAVTLDTGNMHIARSVGLPMIVLAPAWDPGIEWLPWGFDQFRIFKGDDIAFAPPGYQILEVDTAEVLESIDDLLTRYPASATARRQRVDRRISQTRV